ncbi:DUF2799 domain-containing protein [Pseudoalteromonas phenolica]|uniref:DUF2799 domain-containing protein n=1 Tax=Pseudoalteromonas phenolica TaxID=161398 RepID=UPI00110B02CB|nr:DUF2799 domain-containing protein [Pseudoalteromonas phenolica]TMO57248.1 hypothetical protein CWC21_05045 [Pseudoalteromonas phenolica]
MKKIFLLFLLVILSGCESTTDYISKKQCLSANWGQLGYDAATSGMKVKIFDEVKETCAEDIVAKAQPIYMEGFEKGLHDFCTFEKGLELGKAGQSNINGCPYELGKQFSAGYRKGMMEKSNVDRQKRFLEDKNSN